MSTAAGLGVFFGGLVGIFALAILWVWILDRWDL